MSLKMVVNLRTGWDSYKWLLMNIVVEVEGHFLLLLVYYWPTLWSLQLLKTSMPSKRIGSTSEFRFRWLKTRSVLWSTILRQWENVQEPFVPKARMGACYSSQIFLMPIRPMSMTYMQFWHNDLPFGAFELIQGKCIFATNFW